MTTRSPSKKSGAAAGRTGVDFMVCFVMILGRFLWPCFTLFHLVNFRSGKSGRNGPYTGCWSLLRRWLAYDGWGDAMGRVLPGRGFSGILGCSAVADRSCCSADAILRRKSGRADLQAVSCEWGMAALTQKICLLKNYWLSVIINIIRPA